MIFIAMIGMAIQYAVQMAFGFRATDYDLGCAAIYAAIIISR